MVATDSATAWDLKPNRENTNAIFNVLCNVQPVEHPWSGDWYAQQIDVTEWSKQQYRFEKCKWLKKCQLYRYKCKSSWTEIVKTDDVDEVRKNANFTDVITFQWYRLYMRRKNYNLLPYWEYMKQEEREWKYMKYLEDWWDWDEDTCDEDSTPSAKLRDTDADARYVDWEEPNKDWKVYNTSDAIRIYTQPVDIKGCSWDTFDDADETPIILNQEFTAAECNPDHFVMGYWGIGTPKYIEQWEWWAKLAKIVYWDRFFFYIYNLKSPIIGTDYIYLEKYGLYVQWLSTPQTEWLTILSELWLPWDGYFIPQTSELSLILWVSDLVAEWQDPAYKIEDLSDTYIWWFQDFWEIPYFVSQWSIYWIHGYFTRNDNECNVPSRKELPNVISNWDWEDRTWCDANKVSDKTERIFIFTTVLTWWINEDVITWFDKWWAWLTYVAWWKLYVSWQWMYNWIFVTNSNWTSWAFNIPAWITDVRNYNGSLFLLWPKSIYGIVNQEQLSAWVFVSATDIWDWYYSPNSFFNDDWEFLIIRRWKLLETMQFSVSYWAGAFSFVPDTWFYINWHIKPLDQNTDKINIDATTNNRYICIYDDNEYAPYHYSKLLIYSKHYNCWYHWMITWARIVHVKDNIFLWDWVYVNKWRTWGWKENDTEWWEIIEIISAYVWEEWLQTPKHIQYVKTAIWDHSEITKNSKWDINTTYGWKLFERRNDITITRYPRLLTLKNSTNAIETYENGEKIYWHWKLLSHNLINEISEYHHYNKYSRNILREMWEWIDETSKLARFASIKESINAPANVLELCISARYLDNVQFWSFYIWYYVLDADYEDIENTNIDISDASDRVNEGIVINKWEYCDEILEGSACDIEDFNS